MYSLMAVLVTSRRMWLRTEGDFLNVKATTYMYMFLLISNIKHIQQKSGECKNDKYSVF